MKNDSLQNFSTFIVDLRAELRSRIGKDIQIEMKLTDLKDFYYPQQLTDDDIKFIKLESLEYAEGLARKSTRNKVSIKKIWNQLKQSAQLLHGMSAEASLAMNFEF